MKLKLTKEERELYVLLRQGGDTHRQAVDTIAGERLARTWMKARENGKKN